MRSLSVRFALAVPAFVLFAGLSAGAEVSDVQKLRFVQDDAQDYMVSKVYVLKYTQANDLMPFVASMIKRYNMNSSVSCIEYGSQNEQILTVTCPVGMMPYVDAFVKVADRNVTINGKVPGDIIRGTGITRAIYRPKYRSGQDLVNVIVNAVINEGPYGSVYGWDRNSNQIYWKDNATNSEFIFQFLAFLDRPAPQITLTFNLYEVRESTLRDLGVEYLAWKNGPGLNIFQVGFDVFSLSSGGTAAVQAASGPLGGFFFAPQFDASFIRVLQQNGKATLQNTANLTVANSDENTYEILFNPQLQNIVKANNDQTSVGTSSIIQEGLNQVYMKVVKPIACLHSGSEIDFSIPNYVPGQYDKVPGSLFFGYDVQAANVVERNNYGAELIETTQVQGNATIDLYTEKILASWDKEELVEQTIGVPFLSDIPVLKYFFGTTTTSEEKTHVYLTVTAEILNTSPQREKSGVLQRMK
ncbi:MAG: hypothetical protein HPZ91_02905 [Lentisphaeria bacterium]|nr:hypothetical protein [Lentisphaeria bacterium]